VSPKRQLKLLDQRLPQAVGGDDLDRVAPCDKMPGQLAQTAGAEADEQRAAEPRSGENQCSRSFSFGSLNE